MANQFSNSFREYNKSLFKREKEISGLLGIYLSGKKQIEVDGRDSYVYVRLRDSQSEVIQAFNDAVALIYGLPVILVRRGGRYVIKGKDTDRYGSHWGGTSSAYLPNHGGQHSLSLDIGNGSDPTFIYGRQFIPLGVFPSGTDGAGGVIIADNYIYQKPDFSWLAFGITGSPNFLTHKPTGSSAIMILMYADTNTGNYGYVINSGSPFPNTFTGTYDVVPYIPTLVSSTQFPMFAIRLTSGTKTIDYPSLYDVRQYITPYNTGAAGGGGGGFDGYGVTVQEDGVYVISGSVINFVGDNVSVTSSGTIARVYITGASGGGDITGSWDLLYGTFAISGSVGTSTGTATYQRFAIPTPESTITGSIWKVPEGVYASGSLGVFYDGLLQKKDTHYQELQYQSGTYQYLFPIATGTNHMVGYGIPTSAGGGSSSSSGGGLYSSYARYTDTRGQGVDGGAGSAGSWQTRSLNTENDDADNIGTLATGTSQVTLSAGTYRAVAIAPFYRITTCRTRIYDVTNTAILGLSPIISSAGVNVVSSCIVQCRFTLAGSADIAVQYYAVAVSAASIDLGVSQNLSGIGEIYTTLEIWKET